MLYAAHEGADLIVVEGQGAINHPAYAPGDARVDDRLRAGRAGSRLRSAAHARSSRTRRRRCGYAELDRASRTLLATVKPAEVVGIALNTRGLDEDEARAEIERARDETRFAGRRRRAFRSRSILRRDRSRGSSKRPPLHAPACSVSAARLRAAALALLVAFSGCARPQPQRGRRRTQRVDRFPASLRLGEDEEPDSLNLMYAPHRGDRYDRRSALLVLLRYDARGNYIPDLATEVPTLRNGGISRDGKRIVVHLRNGVVWADGAPLTAADWLFTYRAVDESGEQRQDALRLGRASPRRARRIPTRSSFA